MALNDWLHLLTDQWQHTRIWEMIAVTFSVVGVLLAYRNNVLLYPAGLISTGIYTVLMANPRVGLYAEASLNLYYFIMSVYGWLLWSKSKNKVANELPISTATTKDWIVVAAISVLGFLLLWWVLDSFTPSNVPIMDAIVSATAWAGMWLLARRKVENWLLLNISNALAIPLLVYKKMPLTALLTLFLFVVAIFGYYRWRKLIHQKESTAPDS